MLKYIQRDLKCLLTYRYSNEVSIRIHSRDTGTQSTHNSYTRNFYSRAALLKIQICPELTGRLKSPLREIQILSLHCSFPKAANHQGTPISCQDLASALTRQKLHLRKIPVLPHFNLFLTSTFLIYQISIEHVDNTASSSNIIRRRSRHHASRPL
jgi:hypothetical protein